MKFIEKVDSFNRQYTLTAVIVNQQMAARGKIIVRYTKGKYGTNAEVGMSLRDNNNGPLLNFDFTSKCSNMGTYGVFKLLRCIDAKPLDANYNEFIDNSACRREQGCIHHFSTPTVIEYFMLDGNRYQIHWI